MYPVITSIGGLHIYSFGFSILASIFLGLVLIKILSRRYSLEFSFIIDNSLIIFLSTLALGRFFHIIFQWNIYVNNLLHVFYLWDGGLSMWGSILGFFTSFIVICSYQKQPLNKWLDVISTSFLLSSSIIFFGQFCGGQGFGGKTDFFLGVFFENINSPYYAVTVHPTSLYMSILTILLFVVLISIWYFKKTVFYGFIHHITFIFFTISHIATEGFREDIPYWFSGYNAERSISVIILILMIISLFISIKRFYGTKIKKYLHSWLGKFYSHSN